MGIVWENTTPSTEFPRTFVPGSARCSSALCLYGFFLRVLTSKLPLFLLPICMYMISLVWQCGGVGGFMQSFILEVMSIVRAHVAALGGNALTAYHMSQCVLDNNPHKNQVGTHSLSHLKRWIFVGWFYWAFLKSKPTWIMRFSY